MYTTNKTYLNIVMQCNYPKEKLNYFSQMYTVPYQKKYYIILDNIEIERR